MSVYVDDARNPYRRMVMFHMFADSRAELDSMADRIGVARRWRQFAGTYKEHYDVCASKRALAIRLGATLVDSKWVGDTLRRRRQLAGSFPGVVAIAGDGDREGCPGTEVF